MLPLGGYEVIHQWEFWIGAVYVTFPLAFLLYGWNDYADFESDQLNPRKGNMLFGAKLSQEELSKLPWLISLVQLPFLIGMYYAIGSKFLLWILGCLAVNYAYNHPRFGFKAIPFLDVANQAGYLLVFVLSSWLNGVPQLAYPAMVIGAMFAMHSHLLNEIADYEPDRIVGKKTTAVLLGVGTTKLLIVGLLSLEAFMIAYYYNNLMVVAFLSIAAIGFLADWFWRREAIVTSKQLATVLVAWNVIAAGSIYWVWRSAMFIG